MNPPSPSLQRIEFNGECSSDSTGGIEPLGAPPWLRNAPPLMTLALISREQLATLMKQSETRSSPKTVFWSTSWGYRNLSREKRAELMDLMQQDQQIVEITRVNPRTRRASRVFVAAKFVENSE